MLFLFKSASIKPIRKRLQIYDDKESIDIFLRESLQNENLFKSILGIVFSLCRHWPIVDLLKHLYSILLAHKYRVNDISRLHFPFSLRFQFV